MLSHKIKVAKKCKNAIKKDKQQKRYVIVKNNILFN